MRTHPPTRRAALLLALALAGCSGGDGAHRGPAERVVLITCDTLRADRLGVYGYEHDTSPRLDAFARDCLVFDSAYSTAPLTLPALSALMSGRLPDEIGMSKGNKVSMPSQVTTLAEAIDAAGIATAAVVSNWVLRDRGDGAGIRQGFGHYDAEMTDVEANRENVKERLAGNTTRDALAWLDARPSDRFFLWVHYQDPHGPYTPPAEDLAAMERPLRDEAPLPVGSDQRGLAALPRYQVLGNARQPDHYRIRYDAEIRYFDRELGRFLDGLASRGLMEGALVLFSADHGESLGEHDYWFSHGQNVHRELVQVPLLVRYPAGALRPPSEPVDGYSRVRGTVGHLDLFPTVLAAFGLPAPPNHGQSLLTDDPVQGRTVAHTLRAPGMAARRFAVTDDRYRLIGGGGQGLRLYDRVEDPGELVDLAADDPERVERMRAAFEAMSERLPDLQATGVALEMDPETQAQLEALGYVDGDGH